MRPPDSREISRVNLIGITFTLMKILLLYL
jgi:hypothetical protein